MSDRLEVRKAAIGAKKALEDLLEVLQWPTDERPLSLALDRIVEILSETT